MGLLIERIYWIDKVNDRRGKEKLWDGVGIVARR